KFMEQKSTNLDMGLKIKFRFWCSGTRMLILGIGENMMVVHGRSLMAALIPANPPAASQMVVSSQIT
ncbi:endonuclease 8-like 3, partial [Corchorus olitorius]